MQAGLLGLGVWSFLMATAHGAGLMLWPVLMPLCLPAAGVATAGPPPCGPRRRRHAHAGDARRHGGHRRLVYEWVGVEILRRAWLNVDLVWTVALVATGALLLVL